MNSTPAEFRRALTLAFGDAVREQTDGLLLTDGAVQLHFALYPEAPKRIGALQLSNLRVEISVRAGDETYANELLAKVDRATQRGGG